MNFTSIGLHTLAPLSKIMNRRICRVVANYASIAASQSCIMYAIMLSLGL